jgi:hypothetical protein
MKSGQRRPGARSINKKKTGPLRARFSTPAWGRQRHLPEGNSCLQYGRLSGRMAATDCTTAQSNYAIVSLLTQREGEHVSHAVIAKCCREAPWRRAMGQRWRGGKILLGTCDTTRYGCADPAPGQYFHLHVTCGCGARVRMSRGVGRCGSQKFQRCALATRKSRKACTRATDFSSSG